MDEEISIEPRRYKWIEFGDGVDGKILASALSDDSSKRIMILEIESRILDELIVLGKIKRNEITEGNRIKVEIPEEFCHDMLYLTCNPKVRADCGFKGNAISGMTNRYMIALKNEREQNRTYQLQILTLQKDLREATSDIERKIKKDWDMLAKPILEDIKTIVPRGFPSTKTRRRSLEPI